MTDEDKESQADDEGTSPNPRGSKRLRDAMAAAASKSATNAAATYPWSSAVSLASQMFASASVQSALHDESWRGIAESVAQHAARVGGYDALAAEMARYAPALSTVTTVNSWSDDLRAVVEQVSQQARSAGGFDKLELQLSAAMHSVIDTADVLHLSDAMASAIGDQYDLLRASISGIPDRTLSEWKRYPHLYMPTNLVGKSGELDPDRMLELGLDEGIAFAGGMHPDVAVRLHDADDVRAVLGREFTRILGYARRKLSTLENPTWRRHRLLAVRAIDAALEGHTDAAQTLTTTALDAAVIAYVPVDSERSALLSRKSDSRGTSIEQYETHDAFVWLPIWHAYTHWYPGYSPKRRLNHERVPVAYSRHATAHSVSGRQFSKRNVAAAVLITTSLLVHHENTPHKQMPPGMLPEPNQGKRKRGQDQANDAQ